MQDRQKSALKVLTESELFLTAIFYLAGDQDRSMTKKAESNLPCHVTFPGSAEDYRNPSSVQ